MLIRLVAVMLLVTASAQAQVSQADRTAIIGTIEGQMAAFQADAADQAFAFAAPGIQRMFRTPEVFMAMVRASYQPVYRPQEVEFRDLRTTPHGLVQSVLVVGPDGVPVTALYIMEQQQDGTWRIGGCVLAPADDTVI